jgi:hypothetical protein
VAFGSTFSRRARNWVSFITLFFMSGKKSGFAGRGFSPLREETAIGLCELFSIPALSRFSPFHAGSGQGCWRRLGR